MLGIAGADHAEYGGRSSNYGMVPVACPLPSRAEGAPKLSGAGRIRIVPGTRLHAVYGREEAGEARAVELPDHRFFIATLFQPQLAPLGERPHPVIAAYLEAMDRQTSS